MSILLKLFGACEDYAEAEEEGDIESLSEAMGEYEEVCEEIDNV